VARTGGAPRQFTSLGVKASALAWRPDSGALVFAADADQRDEHNYGRADLWVVDLEGNSMRPTDDGYNVLQPAWSPDGEALVFRRQASARRLPVNRGPVYGAPVYLVRLRMDGVGGAQNLTADWALLPSQPQMRRQGDLYFSGGIGGNTHLFRIGSSALSVEQVTSGDRRLNGFTFSTAFDSFAYSMTGSAHPSEMYAAESGEADERKLTGFNDPVLAEVELPTEERILFPSDDGTQVEGWVLVPQDYDLAERLYPLILSIARGSTGYGEVLLWAIWGGWGVPSTEKTCSPMSTTFWPTGRWTRTVWGSPATRTVGS